MKINARFAIKIVIIISVIVIAIFLGTRYFAQEHKSNFTSFLKGLSTTCKKEALINMYIQSASHHIKNNDGDADILVGLCLASVVHKIDNNQIEWLAKSDENYKLFELEYGTRCRDMLINELDGQKAIEITARMAMEFAEENSKKCSYEWGKKSAKK